MEAIDTRKLLRDYADTASETAFRELVCQYCDLVFSTAFRRVGGDRQLAEDVTQGVFTDLARKARTLPREVLLGGWLHRHTCFTATKALRTERRRQAREQHAAAMNLPALGSDADWAAVAPMLDEAINELGAEDRQAVILRFYEQRDLRAVGAALGVSDDAAQKRVSRSLEKLRSLLQQRGVTLGLAALASALVAHAVGPAPAHLPNQVATQALAAATAGTSWLAALLALWPTAAGKIALTTAAAGVAGLLLWTAHPSRTAGARNDALSATGPADQAPGVIAASAVNAPGSTSPASPALAGPSTTNTAADTLRLLVLADDTSRPLRSVPIKYRGWEGSQFAGHTLHTDRDGVCLVPTPRATLTQLEVTTQVTGYADTRLHWRPDRGEPIPADYTLRLIRPASIGGRVVDEDDQPIAQAKVGWNHEEEPTAARNPQDHEFGWVEVETDRDGRWQIRRVAPDMVRRLYGSARHADYEGSVMVFIGQNADAQRQLADGTHVFKLRRALNLHGVVVDATDNPVANAQVTVAPMGSPARRATNTFADGTFRLSGCPAGQQLLTAEADGFAATTIEVEVKPDGPAHHLMLQPGRPWRLRVTTQTGKPVESAHVWYNTFHRGDVTAGARSAPTAQADFEGKTDAAGRLRWDQAPAGPLAFNISAKGFLESFDVEVPADGQEHVVTLSPAVTVFGSVRDAVTGQPLPQFRIHSGYPSVALVDGVLTNRPAWSSLERHRMSFGGGEYRHTFEEAMIANAPERGYILKYEADGYAPFVSRTILPDEGEVRLDAELQPAAELTFQVLLPDGPPAADADVALMAADSRVTLLAGRLERRNLEGMGTFRNTDAKGEFRCSVGPEIIRIVAVHPDGIADAPLSAVLSDRRLTLQRWGRIEGTWLAHNRPAAGRKLKLDRTGTPREPVLLGWGVFQTDTDADGRFAFAKVPPGRLQLSHLVPEPSSPGTRSWSHRSLRELDVTSGTVTQVELGTSGYTLTAKLAWPGGPLPTEPGRVRGGLSTPSPTPPPEILKDPAAIDRWWQLPEQQALARTSRHYPLTVNPDGTLSAEDVPPGTYQGWVVVFAPATGGAVDHAQAAEHATAVARVFEAGTGGPTDRALARAEFSVTIPADPATGTIDLGPISPQPIEP